MKAENHQALLSAIGSLLAPTGVCWIGDPGRAAARDFLRLAQRHYRVELRDHGGEPLGMPPVGRFQLIVLRTVGQASGLSLNLAGKPEARMTNGENASSRSYSHLEAWVEPTSESL